MATAEEKAERLRFLLETPETPDADWLHYSRALFEMTGENRCIQARRSRERGVEIPSDPSEASTGESEAADLANWPDTLPDLGDATPGPGPDVIPWDDKEPDE